MVKEAIRTANLSKRYGTKNVVNNLNLSIKSGEIVGFFRTEWCRENNNDENDVRIDKIYIRRMLYSRKKVRSE